ncbi:ABCC1 [Mytilus edulis]|uniref:ABCC1 n=1 Tax=Mytilus edulis TaxID=6550 RepID=A0A8S3VKT3_MYTED|nr:ABCC1 [Mytilus edulis]
MTTELETNIVAVGESEGIHRNSYRGKIVLIYIYPNIVAVESEGIHRNSYRVQRANKVAVKRRNTTELETNIFSQKERVKEWSVRNPTEIHRKPTDIPTQGVVSENDNRVETNIVAVERVKEYRNTEESKRMTGELETNIAAAERVKEYMCRNPTEVNSSYFIYIPTRRKSRASENDNRVRDQTLGCRE